MDGGEGTGEGHTYPAGGPFQPAERGSLLKRTVPVAESLPEYRPPTAWRDALAGLTVAALALPAALAYAELAGLSPVHGLYALLLPSALYAFLGSSRQLSIGPDGSLSALTAAAVLPLAALAPERAELAAMLALMTAVLFGAARLLRLGWLAEYFSRPVLVGYIHGIVIVLIVSQLSKLLGLSIAGRRPLDQLDEIGHELTGTSGATIAVAAVALGLMLLARLVAPRLPAALLVVVGAMIVSKALDLEGDGVAVVGSIPSGLPSVTVPTPSFGRTVDLVPAALGMFAVAFADGILTARVFATRRGQHVSARQELVAFGAANAAAGLTQAFPVGASGSRTAVNDAMGARTQIAGLVSAATIVVILLWLTAPIAYLPSAVLGAVIVNAAIGLVDRGAWRELWATDRVEVAIAGVTVAGVVLVGVLQSLVFAVGLTIVDSVRRSARPHDAVLGWVDSLGRYGDISLHPTARTAPGVVVYRLDDRLFFANSHFVKGRVREAVRGAPGQVRWFVFDAEAMTTIDATGLVAFGEITAELRREGIGMVVARLKHEPRQLFEEAGLGEQIGHDRFHATVRAAVAACAAVQDAPAES